jgi:signal transduction histidine kinase/ligand-binding sensor domain-containing protein/DNA-binding response OmpR family regulator
LFLLMLTSSFGQEIATSFELYTHLNGLSNSHVNCIAQDKKGFMWFGTDYGLNKFDGFNFTIYTNNQNDKYSLPSDEVSALYVDIHGYLWVGTYNGLARFDHRTESFQNYFTNNDTVQHYKPVRAIAGDGKGIIWVGTSGGGILTIDASKENNAKILNTGLSDIIGNERVYSLHYDNGQNLWIGTESNGLIVYNFITNTRLHFTSKNSALKSDWIMALFEDGEKNIWIGTRGGGLSVLSIERLKFITKLEIEGINDEVFSFSWSNDNTIWIGTKDGGLIVYSPLKKKFSYHKNYLSDKRFSTKRIRAIYKDKDGNIWLGIHQLGVSLLKNYNYPFKNPNLLFPHDLKFSNYSILGLMVDSRNNLWLCTDGNGLLKYNPTSRKIDHYLHRPNDRNSLPNIVVRTVFEDKNKTIWIGTYKGGLSMYRESENNFKNYFNDEDDPYSISYNDVVALAEDADGNLWIATNGGGLCLYNPEKDYFTRYSTKDYMNKTTICSDWLTCLFPDTNGNIWVGSFWGLSKFDPKNHSFRNYYHDPFNSNSLSSNIVFSINKDNHGNIWIGTKRGLNKLDERTGNFTHFDAMHGLPNDVINSILKDKNGNFWLSTNNGLSRFNPVSTETKNFFHDDGLIANEFIHNSMYKSPDGQLFFGSIFGFNAFYPDSIQVKDFFPKVIVTDFKIFNKSVPIGVTDDNRTILENSISETGEIVLKHSDNSFSFDFVSLEYTVPERIYYAYKMEGFENNWNVRDFKRRFVTYTNLDPGTYTFLVKASSRKDVWGEETTRITIRIKPPIYKTGWAYLLFTLLFAIVVLFLWKLISGRITDKQTLKIERIRQAQVDELNQQKLEFFTNISHEFRTPLTLIIGPVENILDQNKLGQHTQKALHMILRNAYRLLRLVNQLLDLRKIEKGKLSLHAVESDLISFTREVYQSFEELAKTKNINFEYIPKIDELIMHFDQDKLDKVLFNLLSNAFQFTGSGGQVKVSIEKGENLNPNFPDGYVRIIVEDTGKGIAPEHINLIFERFYQVPGTIGSMQKSSGIGLSLTKSLVEIHRGIIWAESTKNQGSKFCIDLPLGKSHLNNEEISQTGNLETIGYKLQPPVIEEYEDFNSYDGFENQLQKSIPLVLIVEDNSDIRAYIKSGLNKRYRIAEAENGKEGIEKTRQLMPDLIISDVMMPEMDGIAFTKKIKSDLVSCHIPVILLTAKTSIEHRIEGLETGADSYIPKPFNPRHLQIRIEKLIELRQTLKAKYKSDNSFEPIQIAITSADQRFLKKAVATIKDRISDTNFSVENLGEAVGMSRVHLHRKLKSMVGESPSDFIRNIRLKQAAYLLQNEDIPVSEVCYMVGFSSPSHFSSCFNKQFNMTPSQFKETNRKN